MAEFCARCAKPMKFTQYVLCWRCYTDDKIKAARLDGYASGYRDGKVDGKRNTDSNGQHNFKFDSGDLTEKRLRLLIQLCHPDKHSNSEASVRATQWLLAKLNGGR